MFEKNLPALLQCETASGRSEPSTAQSTHLLPPSRFVKAHSPKTVQALNSWFVITKCPKPISRYSTICFFFEDVSLKFEEIDLVKAGNVWVCCAFGNAFLDRYPHPQYKHSRPGCSVSINTSCNRP